MVVAYFSQMLSTAQHNWSTFDRDLWKIVSAVRHFRHYLGDQECTMLTDHQPFLGYNKVAIQDDVSGRRARLIVELSSYVIDMKHRKCKQNLADTLSRLPPSPKPREVQTKLTDTIPAHPVVTDPMECNLVQTRS